jgi:CRP/FNR family cyclic AMP-dependent transcriptional regulator
MTCAGRYCWKERPSVTRANTHTPDSALAEGLATAWLTTDLRPETRIALAGLGTLTTVEPGEVLTREGEPNDNVGIVLRGRIALRLRVPERGTVTILTVEPGDLVGWSALVPPHRASSTAVALVPSELALFDGAALRDALARDARLAAEVYPLLLNALARRLEGTRLQLLDLFSQRWVEPW